MNNNRKIGILTWTRYWNYGTLLQAYANYTAVRERCADTYLIDYAPSSKSKLYNQIRYLNSPSLYFGKIRSTLYDKFIADQSSLVSKREKMRRFIESNTSMTETAATPEKLKELTACFDALCIDGIPGFCGGDFNCDISSEPFALLNAGGIICASTIAAERTNFIRTHHKNPEYDAEKRQYIPAKPSKKDNNLSIDHIVVRGSGVRVLNYTVITDEEALILSDHCPVLIRAEF